MTVGEIIWLVGIVGWCAIRYPFERQARRIRVVRSERTVAENAGLVGAIVGMAVVPAIAVATGFPAFGGYRQPLWAIGVGTALFGSALWLFWRSHRDLGCNWSISLEIREGHHLVSTGVYARLRHPMYTSFLLMAAGQAFLIPNWTAALTGLAGFAVLYGPRVGKEERLMSETFGDDYARYVRRTNRLIPFIH